MTDATSPTLPPVAILAGGLATRLRPITEKIPKALVEVAGKPFIVHQLELLRRQGIDQVVLCVGYLGEMLESYVGDGSAWNLSVKYSYDGEKLLGTAGALKRALPLLGDKFFVLYGDSYLECDYRAVYESFCASQKPALMTVFRNDDQWDRSNVIFEQGQIVRYDKRNRTPEMQYIDYGLGILTSSVLNSIEPDTVADLADVYSQLSQNSQLAGYEVAQRFFEIGTFEGLQELGRKLTPAVLPSAEQQCPLCKTNDRVYVLSVHGFRVERCTNCGLVSQSKLKPLAMVKTNTTEFVQSDTNIEQDAAKSYLDGLNSLKLDGKSLLIIAESDHPFIRLATESGYETKTVLSPGSFAQTEIHKEQYHAAIIIYQLEKSDNPLEMLHRIRFGLKPNGVLLLVIPTLDSWSARFFKYNWTAWRPENQFYFNNFTVQAALVDTGFSDITVKFDRRQYSLQHVYQRARGYPETSLTRLVKRMYEILPGNLRNTQLRLSTSGLMITARRKELRERPKLSIIMPAYNEKATFTDTLNRVLDKSLVGIDKEIILVESNSTDGTREQAIKYKGHPDVTLILEDRPRGKGYAVRTGLQHATGDYILIQDADSEYDVDDYDILVAALCNYRTAFVLGSRHSGDWKIRQFTDQPGIAAYFNFGHTFFATLFNLLYHQELKDPFTMYKVFWRECLYGLTFECNRFDFDIELVAKLIRKGYKPIEIPVNYRSRSLNEGKKVSVFRDPLTWIWAEFKYRFSDINVAFNQIEEQ